MNILFASLPPAAPLLPVLIQLAIRSYDRDLKMASRAQGRTTFRISFFKVYQQTYVHKQAYFNISVVARVTRLGGFSPILGLFTLGSFFLKITDVAQCLGDLFPQLKLRIDFDKSGLGYTFGDTLTNSSGHTGCSCTYTSKCSDRTIPAFLRPT
jgi:hypothetical protein